MFRAPLCPSSGSQDDGVAYHIGRLVLECPDRRSGHSSILPALNLQPAATREPDGLCGKQRHRLEILMMGIMVPETY